MFSLLITNSFGNQPYNTAESIRARQNFKNVDLFESTLYVIFDKNNHYEQKLSNLLFSLSDKTSYYIYAQS